MGPSPQARPAEFMGDESIRSKTGKLPRGERADLVPQLGRLSSQAPWRKPGQRGKPGLIDPAEVGFEHLARFSLVRAYETTVHAVTSLPLALVRPDVAPTPECMSRVLNPFCRSLASGSPGARSCWWEHEGAVHRQTGSRMAPQIRRCQAGLQVLAVPVQLDGRHVATWMSGQVLGRRPTGEEIATLTRHLNQEGIHIDSRTLESRLLRCPVIASERLQAIGRLLVLSSLHIQEALREHADRVWLRYQQGEPSCVTRAKNFMQMHLGERLTPPQAAAAVHADPGGFTRLFRKATGLSFAAYLTRLRIQRAKVLLAGSLVPYNNIHSASGFPSKARFARAFREATGQTPAAYRAKFSAPV